MSQKVRDWDAEKEFRGHSLDDLEKRTWSSLYGSRVPNGSPIPVLSWPIVAALIN